MKRFVKMALMLCIAMMCVSPQSVQGQNRRTGVSNNSSNTKNERVEEKAPQQTGQRNSSQLQQRQNTQRQPSQARKPQNYNNRQQPQQSYNNRQQAPQSYRPQQNQPQYRQPQFRQQPNRVSAPVRHYENGRTVKPRPAPASIYHYGYCATVLPKGAYRRVYNGVSYYYVDNVFYRPYGNTYIVCRPPVGATFAHAVIGAALTALIVRDALDNSRYYYNNGVYYSRRNDRYTVIDAPVGALVSQLPDGYEEIVIDGNIYYQVDNVLYKTTVYSGLPYFEVAAVL